MTDNPSAVPIQRPQYNSAQTAQVSIVDDYFDNSATHYRIYQHRVWVSTTNSGRMNTYWASVPLALTTRPV